MYTMTSSYAIKQATRYFVKNATIEDVYIQSYEDYGIKTDSLKKFLTGKEMQNYLGLFLSDRISNVLHNKNSFTYSYNDFEEFVRMSLNELSNQQVSDDVVNYTINLMGVGPILMNTTLDDLLNSVVDGEEELLALKDVIQIMSQLAQIKTLAIVGSIYFIFLIFLIVLSYKEHLLPFIAALTIWYPSIIGLGVSLGELVTHFVSKQNLLRGYIASNSAVVSTLFFIFGFFIYFSIKYFSEKNLVK